MSIKKDNVSATAVKYNSQDVNKVILDNKCVWCKPFTYTQGTLPTGVASLTCTRSSTDEPTALTGTIANGGTIYYYDKLYWEATASTGYRITTIKDANSKITVSGDITGVTASGLTSERISGTISQGTLPTGVASITCYRKAYNENSFSEYTGSTIYYGDQFYWTATAATGYNNPSLTYNNSSKVYTWNGNQGGSIDSVSASGLSAGTRKSFTISFGTTANKTLYGSWSSSSQTAYYGDKITVSGNSVICYKWDNNSTARWTVTVSASSNDAQYTYSAVTIAESSIASVTAAATFTAYNTRTTNSYTVTWKYLSAYPDTWATATQTYNYGDNPSRAKPSTVTSGNARKIVIGWDNLATVTGDRIITATYMTQFSPTISSNYCTATMQPLQSGPWYDSGTVITWTANDNYSFGGSTVKDTITQTITSGDATYSATPGYIKCTISCTRCTSAPATGSIIQVGKPITYTANSNYSYTEHATTASNPPEHTVALGTTSYSRSCDYAYITVSGTNCSANVANGYRKIGNSITWTANTNYAFDYSGKTTASQTIESSGTYNQDATYGYYALSLTNCSYSSGNNTGWYTLGTKPRTTVQATNDWSFGGTTANDTTTIGGTVAVPTTVSASPTNFKITVTGSNCTIKVGNTNRDSGWAGVVSSSTTITWTANANYAFTSSGYDTGSVVVNKPGTYNQDASYGKYTVNTTNCKANVSTGWYSITSSKSTTFTANDGWSFGGSTTGDTTTKSAAVPGSVTAEPTNFYITVESGTGCSANVSSGMQSTSNIPMIVWQASHGYAFDSTGSSTVSKMVSSPGTYRKEPTHGSYFLDLTNCSYLSGDKGGWYPLGTKPSTTVQADSGWSFGGSSQDTKAIGGSAAVPTTVSASPAYFYLTFEPTNCKCSLNSGYYTSSTSSVTWTPNEYYSFDAGSTQTSNTHTIAPRPNTYRASPQCVRAKSIEKGAYNASVNRDANTYYKPNTAVTWTAIANHYYDAVGGTIATHNYITAGATIAAPIPNHVKCTISGTNCRADISDGSVLQVGDRITWTRNTDTNSKYSFSSTDPDSTTATATVELGITSYSKTASYLWYNVTSVSGTNCTAYANSNCTTPFTTGWKLSSDNIYWKASAAYAFDTSNKDLLPTSISPGANTANAGYVKQYTLTITKNDHVSGIKAWRTASPYQGAAISSSSSPLISLRGYPLPSYTETATIYYGDSLAMEAGADQYYYFSGDKTVISQTITTVTENVTWSPTIARVATFKVTISAGTGVSSVYLSTDQNATSGSPSGTEFPAGTAVYAFAVLNTAGYTAPSGWEHVQGNIYRVGSAVMGFSGSPNFGTINATPVSGPCTVECSSNLIGLQRVYLSTSSSATSGSSKLNVTPGTAVYGFAVLGSDVKETEINNAYKKWVLIRGTACKTGAIYRVGSKTPSSAGTTSITIELFGSHLDTATVLFTRSGESEGSWSIDGHILQFMDDQCEFYVSGNSIYARGMDYNGSSTTTKLATFNCPAGYTVTYTLKNSAGSVVAWNKWSSFDGPYIIDAETTVDSSQS